MFEITVQSVYPWVGQGMIQRFLRSSEKGKYLIPRIEVVRLLKKAKREITGLRKKPFKPKKRILVIDGYSLLRKFLRKVSQVSAIPS